MSGQISTAELCDRYEQLYTGVVTDVMDRRGVGGQTLQTDIQPIDRGMTTAGIAYPATGRANDSVDTDNQMRRFVEMLADVPENAVLTLNTNDTASSHVGELSTTALANQGCRGVVVEGGVRDTEFILEQGFPVFAQFHTPADSVPRWELLEWGTSAVVGGIDVSQGDVVVGDVDGVAVVPEDIAEDVLLEAEREADTEDALRSDLEDGMNPVDAYEKHQTF